MKLGEARRKFAEARRHLGRIRIQRHAISAHPERGFSDVEIRGLIHNASGVLRDNHVANPLPDSFVFWCKDERSVPCELCVVFDTDDATGDIIVVVSAFRRV